MRPRRSRLWPFDALAVVLLVLAVLLVAREWGGSRTVADDEPGSDPEAQPIYTAQDAISRSIAKLPPDVAYHGEVAHLVTRQTVLTLWYHEEDQGPHAGDWMPPGMWIVGVLADGLTLGDTIALPGDIRMPDPEPVDGAFFLWDASYGDITSSGALQRGTRFEYSDLARLPDEKFVVARAPRVPMPTPDASGGRSESLSGRSSGTLTGELAESAATASPTFWWAGTLEQFWMDPAGDTPIQDVATWFVQSGAVADVEVAAMGDVLFNTDSGESPTQDPGGNLSGLYVGRTVALNLRHAYKGVDPGVVGFVVWQQGGERDGFTLETTPPLVFMSESVGCAFLRPFGQEEIESAEGWQRHVVDAAAAMSGPGAEYVPAWLGDFFEEDGDLMLIALEGDGTEDGWVPRSMDRAAFYEELAAAAAIGTP